MKKKMINLCCVCVLLLMGEMLLMKNGVNKWWLADGCDMYEEDRGTTTTKAAVGSAALS